MSNKVRLVVAAVAVELRASLVVALQLHHIHNSRKEHFVLEYVEPGEAVLQRWVGPTEAQLGHQLGFVELRQQQPNKQSNRTVGSVEEDPQVGGPSEEAVEGGTDWA